MVTQNRIRFSRRLGNSPAGVETENHLTRPRVAELLANDLFHKHWIAAQPFQNPLLLLQPCPCHRQLRRARRLILLEFVVFRPGFEQECACTDTKSSEEHNIKQGN
jgi:hypothetical protein